MDSIFGWVLMAAITFATGIWFALYASAEHDKYLEKRQNGWQ